MPSMGIFKLQYTKVVKALVYMEAVEAQLKECSPPNIK